MHNNGKYKTDAATTAFDANATKTPWAFARVGEDILNALAQHPLNSFGLQRGEIVQLGSFKYSLRKWKNCYLLTSPGAFFNI
jgi:hypothetical protein